MAGNYRLQRALVQQFQGGPLEEVPVELLELDPWPKREEEVVVDEQQLILVAMERQTEKLLKENSAFNKL